MVATSATGHLCAAVPNYNEIGLKLKERCYLYQINPQLSTESSDEDGVRVTESPCTPASDSLLMKQKSTLQTRRGIGLGYTGKLHEQLEIFSGARTVDVLNKSFVHLHSGQPLMARKGYSTFAVAMVQVLLERKRNCTMLVTWKAFQRRKREGKGIRKGRGRRQHFGAMPLMERNTTCKYSTTLL